MMFVDTWIHVLDSCYICLLWCTKFCGFVIPTMATKIVLLCLS